MKVCVTGDIHLKMWADTEYDENGISLKLHEILSAFESICKYAVDNSIPYVIIAGDVNHLKNSVHYKSFVLFKKILDKYYNLEFVIISGNHDEASKEDIYSAVQLLDGPKNVKTVVNNPYVLDDITFIPWSSDIPHKIQLAEPNKLLISHLGLSEAQFSSGLSMRTSIGTKDLKKFSLVVLGHYHLPQTVEHVWYTGSLIQMDRGEKGEEKRFLVVDTDELEVESIPIEGYRKYYEFEITNPKQVKDVQKEVESLKEQGHHITIKTKIAVKLPEFEGVNVISDIEEDFQTRGISSGMKLEEQMAKYVEISTTVPDNEKDEYLEVALDALSEKEKTAKKPTETPVVETKESTVGELDWFD